MDRRKFMQDSLAVTAGVAAAGIVTTSDVIAKPASPTEKAGVVENKVDVLVVGGGTAGAIAAIQAGRAGATTLLVERNGQLGGAMTTGGFEHHAADEVVHQEVEADFACEVLRRLAAQMVHLESELEVTQRQFHLPTAQIEFGESV